MVDRCLYVLFGKHEDDVGNVTCPALLMLETETMMLSHPHFETSGADGRSGIPDDREGHSASVIGTKIYVFGGTWTDEDEALETVRLAQIVDGLITRKVVKQTVMTSVYGVTFVGARQQILGRLTDAVEDLLAQDPSPERDAAVARLTTLGCITPEGDVDEACELTEKVLGADQQHVGAACCYAAIAREMGQSGQSVSFAAEG